MSEVGEAAPSAREVAEKVHQMVQGTHGIVFGDLFAPEGVLEYPFAPPGMPKRVEGRDAIRAFHSRLAKARSLFDMEGSSATIHETADRDVVVVEIEHHGMSHVTGKPYRNIAVGVIEVREGQIVSYRDYMDPLVLARITGRIPQLLEALSTEQEVRTAPA